MVLVGDLQRSFDCGRAAVGIEDAIEAFRRPVDEFFRQPNRRLVGQPEQCRMTDAIHLFADGSIDFRDTKSVNVAPQGRDAIEIPPTVEVDQLEPIAGHDDRRVLASVFLHWREGMPDMLDVPCP